MYKLATKKMKSRFSATYPIEKSVFLKERFNKLLNTQNTNLLPSNIVVTNFKDIKKQYSFEEGLLFLEKHLGDEILLYEFAITPQNTIIEKFYIRGGEVIHLETTLQNEEEIKGFYKMIFPIFGVLVFGEFDMNEEFLVRDDVCSAILHKVLKEYTILTGTWWCDYPNVNHYFVYSEYEQDNEHLTDVMALGGQPLERCVEEPTTTAATFFLGKYINRKGNDVVIRNSDDMKAVQEFEVDFIEMLTAALKVSNVKHRIDYVGIQ